jgi:hypothetical protein
MPLIIIDGPDALDAAISLLRRMHGHKPHPSCVELTDEDGDAFEVCEGSTYYRGAYLVTPVGVGTCGLLGAAFEIVSHRGEGGIRQTHGDAVPLEITRALTSWAQRKIVAAWSN